MKSAIKLILALGISCYSFSGQAAEDINPEWKTCQRNKDCVSALLGCWSWIPIHKKYVVAGVGPFGGNLVKGAASSCRASKAPGPKPKALCRNHSCEF